MKNPCNGCTDRTVACHGVCRRYQEWKAEQKKVKQWLREHTNEPSSGSVKAYYERIRRAARGQERRRR
jgi:hypothetical protein